MIWRTTIYSGFSLFLGQITQFKCSTEVLPAPRQAFFVSAFDNIFFFSRAGNQNVLTNKLYVSPRPFMCGYEKKVYTAHSYA